MDCFCCASNGIFPLSAQFAQEKTTILSLWEASSSSYFSVVNLHRYCICRINAIKIGPVI